MFPGVVACIFKYHVRSERVLGTRQSSLNRRLISIQARLRAETPPRILTLEATLCRLPRRKIICK